MVIENSFDHIGNQLKWHQLYNCKKISFLTRLWCCCPVAICRLSSMGWPARIASSCWMYPLARRRVSNLESFVSAGTQGSFVFRRQKALERTRIRARSRAFAAFLCMGCPLSKQKRYLYILPLNHRISASTNYYQKNHRHKDH